MEPPLIPSPKNSFSVKRERDQTEQPKDRSSEKELAKKSDHNLRRLRAKKFYCVGAWDQYYKNLFDVSLMLLILGGFLPVHLNQYAPHNLDCWCIFDKEILQLEILCRRYLNYSCSKKVYRIGHLRMSAGVASVNFVCTFIGLYLVEKIGRRKLLLTSLFGVVLSLAFLAIGFQGRMLQNFLSEAICLVDLIIIRSSLRLAHTMLRPVIVRDWKFHISALLQLFCSNLQLV